jgi:hypothetical protein
MLLPILIAVAVVVFIFLILVATPPSAFTVTRRGTFSVPPAIVFEHVNNLHLWQTWSYWARIDPAAKNIYAGPPSGVGASMSWAGNNKVGEGRMTIIESRSASLLRFKLEFFKPFKATNSAEFTFESQGSQTLVTWSMSGTNNFMGKAFGLFVNCDKMIGGMFEQGLANLKAIVETPQNKP